MQETDASRNARARRRASARPTSSTTGAPSTLSRLATSTSRARRRSTCCSRTRLASGPVTTARSQSASDCASATVSRRSVTNCPAAEVRPTAPESDRTRDDRPERNCSQLFPFCLCSQPCFTSLHRWCLCAPRGKSDYFSLTFCFQLLRMHEQLCNGCEFAD